MRAKDVMSTPVHVVHPGDSVKHAAELLVRNDISALPVVDASDDLVGIISEAELLSMQRLTDPRRHVRAEPNGGSAIRETVEGMMKKDVITVTEDEDVTTVARMMLRQHIRRIVVVSGTKVAGIISRRDIMKVLARSDESIAAELQYRLDDDRLILGPFTAAVSEGVVTLTGPSEPRGRELAALVARSVPGVVAVRFADGD